MVFSPIGWFWFTSLSVFAAGLACLAWCVYAWERSRPGNAPVWLVGGLILVWLNFKHYLWALWGIGLRLDPDYPCETRFRGDLVVDSVLEYRGYGLFVLWCPLLAFVLPRPVPGVLAVAWSALAFWRAGFYSSPFKFWTRAYNEAPNKHRNRIRYFEEISLEIERRIKQNENWNSTEIQELILAGRRIQDCIVEGKK